MRSDVTPRPEEPWRCDRVLTSVGADAFVNLAIAEDVFRASSSCRTVVAPVHCAAPGCEA
jgi:hypothetical protein